MTYELHPLCVLFPRLVGAEFDGLRDDIAANGLRTPIVLHDGMILDGGNRYQACLAAGVQPTFSEFEGGSLVAFVLAANLHRRHMAPGQRAAIVASAEDWATARKPGREAKGEALHLSKTVADRAAVAGTTTRTQKDADKLAREHPDAAVEVAQGKKSLHQAVKESKPAAKKSASKKTKPAPAKTAKQVEAEQIAEDAHGGASPTEMMDEMHADIERLTAEVRAMQADDQKAETLKWRRMYDSAVRAQADAMDRVLAEKKLQAFAHRQLMRCGKAVGVDDPDKIAPAVEAFVRQFKKEAA